MAQCSFSNLTYNQWLSGAVLKNPLPGQVVRDLSFQRNYAGYTQLMYPLELFYYAEKSDNQAPAATISQVYESFNFNGLYNPQLF